MDIGYVAVDETWPMFHHDLHNTGLSPLTGDMDTCYQLWEYPTGANVFSSPAIADINGDGDLEVVVGSWDNNVYALNGADGSFLWSYPTGDNVSSSPSLGDIDGDGDLEVVVGSHDNNIYALNGADGSFLWSYWTYDYVNLSPAIADIDGDGNLEVVVGSYDNKVYALSGQPPGVGEHTPSQTMVAYLQVSPNPFRDRVSIKFSMEHSAEVIELKIYDATGRLVRQWGHTTMRLSDHISWDGTDHANRPLPSGVYFLKLQAGDYSTTEKVLLIR